MVYAYFSCLTWLGFGFSLKTLIFCHVYTPMHLFSVSTAIPVFALAVVLVNSNLSLALSDFSARIVAFAYTGWDISLSGTAASWSFFSLLLLLSRDLVCILNLFGFLAVWALLLAGIGFPLLLT